MIEETLCIGKNTPENLRKLIEACHAANMFSNTTRLLIEHIPAQVVNSKERVNLLLFKWFTLKIPFERYNSGRIFTNQLELRWELQGKDMWIVYLGPKLDEAILRDYGLKSKGGELKGLTVQEKSYFLFGQRLRSGDMDAIGVSTEDGNFFTEARIPRLLYYPVHSDKRGIKEDEQKSREYVQLHVREFFDERGSVAFFRFYGLTVKEIQDESI